MNPRTPPQSSAAALCLGLALLAAVITLPACKTAAKPTRIYDYPPPPAEQMPSYRQLAQQYNQRIVGIDKLWSRIDLKLRYIDRRGKARSHNADDSKLILDGPARVALVAGASAPGVGMVAWAGCDEQKYWLFELGDERVLYWGWHRNVGHPLAQPLPAPIHPLDLPLLLGLVPIDPAQPGYVDWDRRTGNYILEPAAGRVRFLLDSKDAAPQRILLTRRDGAAAVEAFLSDHRQLQPQDPGAWAGPTIALRCRMKTTNATDSVELIFESFDLDPSRRRLNPRQFDLDLLTDALKPDRIVQLDQAVDKRPASDQPQPADLPTTSAPPDQSQTPPAPEQPQATPPPTPPAIDPAAALTDDREAPQ